MTSRDQEFLRYLEAKRTIDDRSLHPRVFERLLTELTRLEPERPLRLLEIGAGSGTMIERLAAVPSLAGTSYTAVDRNPACIEAARGRTEGRLPFGLELVPADLFDLDPARHEPWDVVIAHAVLDLLDLDRALAHIRSLTRVGALYYFTLNFDGVTAFEPTPPTLETDFERRLEAAYHRTMDTRRTNGLPAGSSRTGRELLAALRRHGARTLEAGPSDWIVFAGEDGFRDDEATFLGYLAETVVAALWDDTEIDRHQLEAWRDQRHAQIADGSLVYIAHQIDVLARREP